MTQLRMHHVGFFVDELAEGARHFVTTLGFRIETHFQSPWDGSFVMDRMVRWVSLGGPL